MKNVLFEEWNKSANAPGIDHYDRIDEQLKGRTELTSTYSWAIPNDAVIQRIAEWSPIVEIGAGRGYWAALIHQAGAEIVAYDKAPPLERWQNQYHRTPGLFFNVEKGGPAKVDAHPNHTLLLCWPPYSESMATDCLVTRPKRVVYVGEGEGGCNADDEFFEILNKEYEVVDEVNIPQWWGLHDYASFWERR